MREREADHQQELEREYGSTALIGLRLGTKWVSTLWGVTHCAWPATVILIYLHYILLIFTHTALAGKRDNTGHQHRVIKSYCQSNREWRESEEFRESSSFLDIFLLLIIIRAREIIISSTTKSPALPPHSLLHIRK